MSQAQSRRAVLRDLLVSGQVGSQDELCGLLRRRGYPTTQSTVSRDLKQIGAERRSRADGEAVYMIRTDPAGRFPAEMVVGVEHNEQQIVIRTRVGRAPAVGIELDGLGHPDLLGTIAGDDTVLVIPRSITQVEDLVGQLRDLAGLDCRLPGESDLGRPSAPTGRAEPPGPTRSRGQVGRPRARRGAPRRNLPRGIEVGGLRP